MLPEQVWDADPIPSRRLAPGRPTGSAMPLVWAHAEFIKLLVSRHQGHPIDRPRAVWQRYRGHRPAARHAFWWPHAPIAGFPAGALLAVALPLPAVVHWGRDGWLDRRRADPRQRPRLSRRGARHRSVDTRQLGRLHLAVEQNSGAWAGRDIAVTVRAA